MVVAIAVSAIHREKLYLLLPEGANVRSPNATMAPGAEHTVQLTLVRNLGHYMTTERFLAFCALELVLCLTPGPAVLFVISTGLARGVRAGIAGAAGIVAGNTLYFALSGLGVAAIIMASGTLFTAIRWIGAGYLVYLGLRILITRDRPGTAIRVSASRDFARGFAVQASNPKALAFFVALLPQFIDPASAVGEQVVILGVASQAIEIAVLGGYLWLTQRAWALGGPRVGLWLRKISGGLLVAAGARLALAR
jgi:homoserine/homoserine lactone efflux protein